MAKGQGLARATAILGLARIVQQALLFGQLGYFLYVFGSNETTDALIIAQTLPTFFALVFTRAFSQSFVPIFAEWRESRGLEDAWRLSSAILMWTLFIAGVLTGIVALAAPWIVVLLAPGMSAESQELSASLLRSLAALIAISAVSSLPRSLYFSFRSYTVPAITPVLPNLATIAAIYLFSSSLGIRSVIWGMLAGWTIELVILVLLLNRGQQRFRFTKISMRDGVRRFRNLLAPRAAATAIARINVIVDRMFASGLSASSISALNYADALTFAPLELVNASFGTATLTVLSDDIASGQFEQFKRRISQYIKLISFIVIPMTVLFILLSYPLIDTLFGRGAFGEQGVRLTAAAVTFYSIGLLPTSLVTTLYGSFFALQDSMTPLKVSLFGCILNALLDWALVGPLGLVGLALASALCAYARLILLVWLMEKKIGSIGLGSLATTIAKLLAAAAAMAGIVWLCSATGMTFAIDQAVVRKVLRLGVLTFFGGITFLIACRVLGVSEVSQVLNRVRNVIARRRGRQLSDA